MIARQDRCVVLKFIMVFLINQVPGAATAGCEKAGNGELWGRAERGLIAVHALILEPRLIDYFCAQHLRVADLQFMLGAVVVVGQLGQFDTSLGLIYAIYL